MIEEISQEILAKAAQGDLAAFERIYRASSGFVYNVALRTVHDREEAEEVTQEVFLTIYRKLKWFRFQASFKTWVYRITANCAINHAKKLARERGRVVEYDEYAHAVEGPNNIEAGIEKEHRETLIDSLLSALNPDQRACVVLRNIEGMDYRQIADTLRININTVRSRLKRARETLLSLRKEVAGDGL